MCQLCFQKGDKTFSILVHVEMVQKKYFSFYYSVYLCPCVHVKVRGQLVGGVILYFNHRQVLRIQLRSLGNYLYPLSHLVSEAISL